MEFTETEARWFIGIAIILGCAFVALLCDYYKGMSERLRERTMELLARNEEIRAQASPQADPNAARDRAAVLDALADMRRDLEKAMKDMAEKAASAAAAAAAATAAPPPAPAPPPADVQPPARPAPTPVAPAAPAAKTPAAERPNRPIPPLQPAIATLLAATKSGSAASKPAVKPMETMPKPLELPKRVAILPGIQESMARVVPPKEVAPIAADAESEGGNVVKIRVLRNQQPIETEMRSQATAPAEESLPMAAALANPGPKPMAPTAAPANDPWKYTTKIHEPVRTTPEPTPMVPPMTQTVAPFNFELKAVATEPQAPVRPEIIPTADGSLGLPAGMHDRATLDFLLEDPTPFTGLVVSIGINDFTEIEQSSGADAAAELVSSIAGLVASLTANPGAPEHFACKVSADEFVICYNGEIGPVAQRRMSALSERLWDFQLRSMGTFSVVFSWGATEANEEALSDAIDAASERMRETRQNRASMGGARAPRRVVA